MDREEDIGKVEHLQVQEMRKEVDRVAALWNVSFEGGERTTKRGVGWLEEIQNYRKRVDLHGRNVSHYCCDNILEK